MKTTMSKKLLALILALAITLALAPALGANAAASAGTLVAVPTSAKVLVDGKNVDFDAYNIAGNNYFKLRDIAYTLSGSVKQFAVGWDGDKNAISLTSGRRYLEVGGEMTGKGAGNKTPNPTSSMIYLDNREISLTAYNISGNNYFKLRDVGKTLNFGVDWDDANRTIAIATNSRYRDESGSTSYSASYFGAAQGSAKALEGRSVLVSIFLSRENPGWSAEGISRSANYLQIAADFLVSSGAGYGKDIELIHDFEANPDLRYDMFYDGEFGFHTEADISTEDPKLKELTNAAIDEFIEDNIPYMALADKYGTDSIGYVVFVDKGEGVSFAFQKLVGASAKRYHEKAIITGKILQSPSTMAHEILHLFSAVDLYVKSATFGVDEAIMEYTKANYSNEIMLGGWSYDSSGKVQYDKISKEITPLTAYCIAWLPTIPELTQFKSLFREVPSAAASRRELLNGAASWDYSPNGVFTGNYVNGIRVGRGVFEFTDGGRYEGNWESDNRSGYGINTWKSGDKYEGNWKNDKMSGHGTYTWANGDIYVGNFENGVKAGQGIYTWTSGQVYTGNFGPGGRSGQGTCKYASGSVYTGDWENDKRTGQGTCEFSNGDSYTGYWVEDRITGFGTCTYKNGNVYTGNWLNGKHSGEGRMKYASGRVYDGSWDDGFWSGYGELTYTDGKVQAGLWNEGKFVGDKNPSGTGGLADIDNGPTSIASDATDTANTSNAVKASSDISDSDVFES